MTDFIIVGRGIAAHILALTLHKYGLSFKIIGKTGLSRSSYVAAGIWNPIVFKRLTSSWLAHLAVPFLETFYSEAQDQFGKTVMHKKSIIKPFVQQQEKELWLKKSKNELPEFLGDIVRMEDCGFNNCAATGEGGVVLRSGNIDVSSFLTETEKLFSEFIGDEIFDYSVLDRRPGEVSYKGIQAKNIIFCEGHLVKENPFFSWVPMKPAKGEVLEIATTDLELNNYILNKGNFILGAGDTFKTGATYEWDYRNDSPTPEARTELERKLKQLITCDYTIINHQAGIRPSTIDRRPVIGRHPVHENLFIFNGLGTKGVMLAPWIANNFVFCYQHKQPLNAEADVKRFYHLYERAG